MWNREESVVRSRRTSWRRVMVAESAMSAKPLRLFSSCLKWSQLLGDLTKSVCSRHKRRDSVRAAQWERRANYMSAVWTSWKRASCLAFPLYLCALSELSVRPSRSQWAYSTSKSLMRRPRLARSTFTLHAAHVYLFNRACLKSYVRCINKSFSFATPKLAQGIPHGY